MSSYTDINGIENLRQASQSIRPENFKTYVEGKAYEVQNNVADVITGLGNELMGHASIKTLEHLGKAKKAVDKATRDFADRATKAMSDARDGVRARISDALEPAQQLRQDAEDLADRVSNPFGGTRIEIGEDGQARLAVRDDDDDEVEGEDVVLQPQQARGADAPTPTARPAPEPPAQVEPEDPPVQTGGGGGGGADVSTDAVKGAEVVAKEEGEKVAEEGGEQILKKGLKGAFLESLGEDESPIGIGATAVLGVATLIAGIVSHHHDKPPVAVQHYQDTQPINFNYQAGL